MTTDVDLNLSMGTVLRQERIKQGRDLRLLSEQAYTSYSYLSEVERGRKNVSPGVLASICNALGVTVPQLLRATANHMEKMEENYDEMRYMQETNHS